MFFFIGFYQQCNLKRHMLSHNTQGEGEGFNCVHCQAHFTTKSVLSVHMRDKHGDKSHKKGNGNGHQSLVKTENKKPVVPSLQPNKDKSPAAPVPNVQNKSPATPIPAVQNKSPATVPLPNKSPSAPLPNKSPSVPIPNKSPTASLPTVQNVIANSPVVKSAPSGSPIVKGSPVVRSPNSPAT